MLSPAESRVYRLEFSEFQAQLHWIQLLCAVIFPQFVCCSQALLLKIESCVHSESVVSIESGEDPQRLPRLALSLSGQELEAQGLWVTELRS